MRRTPTRPRPGLALIAGALALALAAEPAAAPDGGGARGVAQPGAPPPVSARATSGAAASPDADSLVEAVARARGAAREGRPGEAARRFAALADGHPEIAPWLRLSALQHAARAADTAIARAVADALGGEPAVGADSVALELARARFRAGDTAAAVADVRTLEGDEDPDFWVRWAGPALLAAGDTARARSGYLVAAAAADAPAEAGTRLLALDPGRSALERLARADLREGRGARGRELLRRALDSAPSGEAPRLGLRLAEARLDGGLPARAHATAARWLSVGGLPGALRARLEMAAASSHFRRGQDAQGEVHLRRGRAAGGGEASARAAYLLADRAHGSGDRDAAVARYRAAAESFPRTRHGGLARMRLGFLALGSDRPADAASHFRAYRRHQPRGDWGSAALYWEGRARRDAGAPARGTGLLRDAARRDPAGYYGVLAARRLEEDPWGDVLREADRSEGARSGRGPRGDGPSPAPGDGSRASSGPRGAPAPGEGAPGRGSRRDAGAPPRAPSPADPLGAMLERMATLRALGWEDRALRELEVSRAEARRAVDGPLALARALNDAGWTSAGIGLAWEAFDRAGGVWSRELLEGVFPLPHRESVVAAARDQGISPALVAGVARQESAFDPRAVSSAGAVGLMQLMPATAAELARASRRPAPDRDALTNPELSLALGARYLADLLARFDGSRTAALISYNAGPRRYLRWRSYPEFRGDRELMIERIPYAETRRYVKAVLRNVELYRRLYDLEGAPATSG